MSKQKVFSHDIDINYNDYTKNKNGIEILKNMKSKNCTNIKKFINYNEFIILTNAYYKHLKPSNDCDLFTTKNLYHSNISFITYNTILNHVNECNCCSSNNQPLKSKIYNTNCETIKNILYPY